MGKFDRYLLSQLMLFFGFFSIVLVLVYWINRAVILFDWLIASGQSATTFLEFTALTLPNVIRLVLPISAFAAAVYTANRLNSESELVVVQATGYGPARMCRAVLVFGLLVGLFVSALVHFVVPASYARLADREVEVAENVTARLLTEGRFVHPDPAMTIYIREITGQGDLQDVLFHDAREPERPTTYTAVRARIVRTAEGPRIVMFDGIAQTLTLPDRRLAVTRFEKLAVDASAVFASGRGDTTPRNVRELSTPELLRADPEVVEEVSESRNAMLVDGHQRFSQPLMSVIAPILGFATLLLGGFSRFGVRRQVFGSVLLVVALSTLDNSMNDAANSAENGWPLVYLPPLTGLILTLLLLWMSANPHGLRLRFWQRRQAA